MNHPMTAATAGRFVECSRCKEHERADWRDTDAAHLFGPCPFCDKLEYSVTYGEAGVLAFELWLLRQRAQASEHNVVGDLTARRLHNHIEQLTRILSMGSAHADPQTLRNVQEQKNAVVSAALAWFDSPEGELGELMRATRELKRITKPQPGRAGE